MGGVGPCRPGQRKAVGDCKGSRENLKLSSRERFAFPLISKCRLCQGLVDGQRCRLSFAGTQNGLIAHNIIQYREIKIKCFMCRVLNGNAT